MNDFNRLCGRGTVPSFLASGLEVILPRVKSLIKEVVVVVSSKLVGFVLKSVLPGVGLFPK